MPFIFHNDALLGLPGWLSSILLSRHYIYNYSATPFYFKLLPCLHSRDISVFLNFRVDVIGANQYVSIYFNYVQMNYLVLCYFLVKITYRILTRYTTSGYWVNMYTFIVL